MPKYRVVTPKGASFTVAGSDYSYEREALDPIDAEIVEAPANEAEFIAAAKNADAIYAKGIPITKTIIDALLQSRGIVATEVDDRLGLIDARIHHLALHQISSEHPGDAEAEQGDADEYAKLGGDLQIAQLHDGLLGWRGPKRSSSHLNQLLV